MQKSSAGSRWTFSFGIRMAIFIVLTGLLLALAWAAWGINLERACLLRQWPELQSCIDRDQSESAQHALLLEQIERNPGESEAWIQLALLSRQPNFKPGQYDHDAILDIATRLAKQDRRLHRLQAIRAVQRQQWAVAVDWLIRLVEDGDDGQAAVALATMMREPLALAAMKNHIKPGRRWFGLMVGALPQARVPVVEAMPLVVQAVAQQSLSPELLQQLLQQLKTDKQWIEARALWNAWLGRPSPLIFNGDFNNGFIPGGFDWEVTPEQPSKAGALVRQVALDKHGGVLQVEFTGRPVAVPVIRQHLVLFDKRYLLSGQFMTARFLANEGLAWTVNCANDGREIARTPAIKDKTALWQSFRLEFEVPPGCANAVALQLQTFAPYESTAGLRGQATFDDFKLETLQ